MTNQDTIKAIIKRMSGQSNVIAIPRIYLDLLDNDHAAAFFLSQAVYWSDRSSAEGGWFWKSAKEWKDEIGVSTYQLNRVAVACGEWVETKLKKANGAPTLYYRVNMEALTVSICEFLENPLSRKSKNSQIDLRETPKSLTETTTKIEEEEEEAEPKKPAKPAKPGNAKVGEYIAFYEKNIGYPGAPGGVIYEGIFEWAGKVSLEYWKECVTCYAKNNGHTFTFLERILTNGPREVGKAAVTQPTTARPSRAPGVTRTATPQQPTPGRSAKDLMAKFFSDPTTPKIEAPANGD